MKNNLSLSYNLMVLCILLLSQVSCSVSNRPSSQYIKKSCQTTLYPNLCYKSLAKYATKIRKSPILLANTALLVTFNKTRSTSKILRRLLRNRALMRPGEVQAVLECVEEVSDSVYELHKSLKELKESRKVKGPEFELRMNDIQTWVSAALTDDDTCMDDFKTKGEVKVLVRRLLRRIVRLTSIALAFINNYAAD